VCTCYSFAQLEHCAKVKGHDLEEILTFEVAYAILTKTDSRMSNLAVIYNRK